MPNDLNRNNHLNHLIDDNDKSSRKKLAASSGFTASVWTLSGVVLAACGSLDDLFSDGGGGGARGNTVSVNASPVAQARVYFDMDGDGRVDQHDIELQNQQYPEFITDARGLAHGIPAELYGRPFKAILDGAFDAETGQQLEGEYYSVPGADGRHSIASPITDLIAQAAASPDLDVEEELARLLVGDDGVAIYTPEEIAELADALLLPQSYLDASGAPVIQVVQGLAKYLADNKAKQEAGQGHDEAEDYTDLAEGAVAVVEAVEDAMLSPNPVVILNADTDETEPEVQVQFSMGEHDDYVGIINAIAKNGAPVRFEILGDATADYSGIFTINNRGVISVAEGAEIEAKTYSFQVAVRAGRDHAPTHVDVEIAVREAPDIELHDIRDWGYGEVTPVGLVNENIRPSDGVVVYGESNGNEVIRGAVWVEGTVLDPEWVIRGDFADYFEMVREPDGRFSLALKEGYTLDYEAIEGGATIDIYGRGVAEYYERVVNLQVAVKDATEDANGISGVLSEFIDLQVVVLDIPEAEFSGDFTAYVVEDENIQRGGNLVVRGTVNIAEESGGARFTDAARFTIRDYDDRTIEATEADGIYTMTLAHGTFTYNLESGEWVYTVDNFHDDVQSLHAAGSFSDIFIFEAENYDATISSRAVYLNVLGANEELEVYGTAKELGTAEFALARSTGLGREHFLEVMEIAPDPEGHGIHTHSYYGGDRVENYKYTWYMQLPGQGPTVIHDDGQRFVVGRDGNPSEYIQIPAGNDYATSQWHTARLAEGAEIYVEVEYTDNAGNDHVVKVSYPNGNTHVDTIDVGTDNLDGNLNLGNALPTIANMHDPDSPVEYRLADTGAHYERLFHLDENGELIFTGNARDASALGSGVELQLEVRVPDETTETIAHTIVVDVTGTSTFELARSETRGLEHFFEVTEIIPDPDGVVATHSYFGGSRVEVYSYRWYFEEVGEAPTVIHEDDYSQTRAGRLYIPAGDDYATTEWHSARLAEGARFFVEITYTDGNGNVETLTVSTSRVSFADDVQMDTAMEGQWGVTDALATATATTLAPNGVLRYTLSENPDDLFTINAETGAISFASATDLDYEDSNQQKRYQLEVTATDTSLPGGNTATQTIIIDVANADEDDAVYAVRGVIGDGETLRAVLETPDLDGGMTDIRYQWFIGEDAIAGATGATYTIGSANLYADYSVAISYNDAASQEGDDPRTTSAAVKAPIFAERADGYTLLIPENRDGVLLTVEATYGGAAAGVSYALIGADAMFEINADSGAISLAQGATLNYATATQHSLTVAASYTDANDRTFTKWVDVVIDVGELVNDDAPVLTALTDAGRARHDREAPEDGTDTGIRFSVSDADIDEVNKHQITTSQDDKFEVKEIDGAWGVFLKEGQSIDFDALNADSIGLTITITDTLDDGTQATDDIDATIARYNSLSWDTDADAGTQRFWVPEGIKQGGASVTDVSAISAESGDVKYAFADGTLISGFFAINEETGAITFTSNARVNDGDAHQHILEVVASDEANGDSIAATITIDVRNIDLDIFGTVKDPGTAEFALGRSTGLNRYHFLEVTEIAPDPQGGMATHTYQRGSVTEIYKYTWYMQLPGEAATVLHKDFTRTIIGSGDVPTADVKFAAGNDYATDSFQTARIAEGAKIYVEVEYTDGANNKHVVTVDYPGGASHLDTIIIGTHNLDGNLNLGNALPIINGRRDPDGVVEYELVDTGAAHERLFQLNDAGEMIFTGNTRDAEALGSSVELQLEVRVPDETDEVFTHKIVVDVTGTSTFELARSETRGLEHFFEVTEITPDPDGVVATHSYFSGTRVEVYSYRWYFEEVGKAPTVIHEDGYSQQRTGRPYIPAGDDYATTEWHSERLAEGGYFFVDITYTDGDGNVHDVRVSTRAEYTLEGTATPGATLEVRGLNTDYADIDDSIPIKYRWFEQDPDGANRAYIGDETSTTHTLADTNAAKTYGVVVEYTNTNGGTFTAAQGNAHEVIADSVVFDKSTYTESSIHENAGEGFDGFAPTAYFGEASNNDVDYQFAPGSTTDNGNSIRIKAGSDNTIIEEIKYIDGNAQISDLLKIDTDTGEISYAGDTYLDATNFKNNPDVFKTYTIMVRGIHDADGDGIDADDPFADVSYVITVAGKHQAGGLGEAKIPNHQQAQAHDPVDPHDPDETLPPLDPIIAEG